MVEAPVFTATSVVKLFFDRLVLVPSHPAPCSFSLARGSPRTDGKSRAFEAASYPYRYILEVFGYGATSLSRVVQAVQSQSAHNRRPWRHRLHSPQVATRPSTLVLLTQY